MQQINLYPAELRPTKEWLTLRSLGLVTVGFIAMLAFSYAQITIHQGRIEQSVTAIEAEYVSATERIERITGRANPSTTQNLETIKSELRQKISQRRSLSQIIENQNLGNETGFSQALTTIARNSLSTISLERIRLQTDQKLVELAGLCRVPQDVAKYIDSLSHDPSFAKLDFGPLSMTQLEKSNTSKKIHKFSIGFESVYQLAEGNQ